MTSKSGDPLPSSSFIYEIPIDEVKFSKEDRLGSGSFGDVYSGRWRNRNVAVKVFRRQKESFKNELKQLSEIRHPNIVRLYGSSQSPNSSESFLIMELADCPLEDLLHERQIQEYDLRHACNWAYQAAAGMSYCHDLKPKAVIHRDIKPANLLLFEGGKVLKICDFGTAVSQRSTMTNNTGTVCYMAPEVFKDVHYDARCDVFSWSIMFWEILARKKPYFDCKDFPVFRLQSDILERGLRPNPLINCPLLIWNLIEKSWDGEPQNRPHMKMVVREMVKIRRIAGIKSNRSSISHSESSNDNTNQIHQASSSKASASSQTSVGSPVINLPHSLMDENDDISTKKRMAVHINALSLRLKLARDRQEQLVLEASNPIARDPLDKVDEFKELYQQMNENVIEINSLKDRLSH